MLGSPLQTPRRLQLAVNYAYNNVIAVMVACMVVPRP